MISVCPRCATRLQLDQEKSPNRPFNVRCPKCNATIRSSGGSPATEQSALAVGDSPATHHSRFEQPTARAYEPPPAARSVDAGSANEAMQMMAGLLAGGRRRGPEACRS